MIQYVIKLVSDRYTNWAQLHTFHTLSIVIAERSSAPGHDLRFPWSNINRCLI